jgi:hypothetical protein
MRMRSCVNLEQRHKMIHDYDPNSVYEIFELSDDSHKYKIGEIESGIFFDVNKNGKRIGPGFRFTNNLSFWNQFNKISVKKINRPLDGYEPIVWAVYWTISALISIVLIIGGQEVESKVFWLITSILHFIFTIKFRNNTYVVYWMAITSVFVIAFIFLAGSQKKK